MIRLSSLLLDEVALRRRHEPVAGGGGAARFPGHHGLPGAGGLRVAAGPSGALEGLDPEDQRVHPEPGLRHGGREHTLHRGALARKDIHVQTYTYGYSYMYTYMCVCIYVYT